MDFKVNYLKSSLTPTQSLQWLGMEWDTTQPRVRLSPENAARTSLHLPRLYFEVDVTTTVGRTAGNSQLRSRSCPSRSITSSQTRMGGQCSDYDSSPGPSTTGSTVFVRPSTSLASQPPPPSMGPLDTTFSVSESHYGSFGPGMGVSVISGTSGLRRMGERLEGGLYQRLGAPRSPPVSPSSQESAQHKGCFRN